MARIHVPRIVSVLIVLNLFIFSVKPESWDNVSKLYFYWGRSAVSSKGPLYENDISGDWRNGSEIHDICRAFIVEFGRHSAKFIECSIDNARPFLLCEECVTHYTRANSVFKDLNKNDETRENCKGLLLNSDRVQVINNVYKDIQNIWESSDCEDCFDNISEYPNGTVSVTLKESTIQFKMLYDNFTHCVPKNMTGANDTVCEDCLSIYTQMNTMYNSLRNPDTPRDVCMDIVDMMNYTRLMWGKELKCTKTFPDDTPIIIIAIFLCLMPVSFYTSMKAYGTERETTVLKQKRMSHQDSQYRRTAYAENSFKQLISDNNDSGDDIRVS